MYQRAILDWIHSGRGDAIVEAVAGSGKTTTLEMAWQQVQDSHGRRRAIFLAFNKSVATELQARLPGMAARTLHSLGNQPTRRWIGRSDVEVSDHKYAEIIRSFLERFGLGNDTGNRFLVDDLKKVIDLARYSLIEPWDADALQGIVDRHHIGRGFGKVERYLHLVPEMCEVGRTQAANGYIDFADQLWIPHVVNAPVETYDWIFVDESQDLNLAQLHLVLRSRAPGGRIIFVGDPKQAIYGFAGSDSEAMRRIQTATRAVRLPLSITYRCARSHVVVARRIVPQLEARPGAPEGVFAEISIERGMALMQPGDLVLCRETAPTVELQRRLDDRLRDAYVEDETRRKRLTTLLLSYRKRGTLPDDVLPQIEEQIGRLEQGDDTALEKLDRLDSLKALHAALRGRSSSSYAELQRHVDRVFAPRPRAVRCMTIHKAKGLEADRVFLIYPHLLPHRFATRLWQVEQEQNLLYVALTRAKTELYVCHGEIAFRYVNTQPGVKPSSAVLPFDRGELGTKWAVLGASPLRRVEPVAPQSLSRKPTPTVTLPPPPRIPSRHAAAEDPFATRPALPVALDPFVIGPGHALTIGESAGEVAIRNACWSGLAWAAEDGGFAIASELFSSLAHATATAVKRLNAPDGPSRVTARAARYVVALERLGSGAVGPVAWSVIQMDDGRVVQPGSVTLPEFRLDDLAGWLSGSAF